MRRFESLVMSKTEPVTDNTLWIRRKKGLMRSKPNELSPKSVGIWYFGEDGWMPLIDFDTKYNLNDFSNFSVGTNPIKTEVIEHHDNGTIDVNKTFNFYNGNRPLEDAVNFVNETGLKKHVDDLQGQINALKSRVNTLESKVSSLEAQIGVMSSQIANNSNEINNNNISINNLSSRVAVLESKA